MKSFSFITMFLVAPSFEFPAANLLDGLQQVSIDKKLVGSSLFLVRVGNCLGLVCIQVWSCLGLVWVWIGSELSFGCILDLNFSSNQDWLDEKPFRISNMTQINLVITLKISFNKATTILKISSTNILMDTNNSLNKLLTILTFDELELLEIFFYL